MIRHGALGDVFLSFAPFAAIRAHHPRDEIVLLTTAAFAGLLAAAPWFDRVETDRRPPAWDFAGLVRLRRQLAGFDLVYDLQTSARSSRYFRLAGRPPWSGIAAGCRYPDAPGRDLLHTIERQRGQLERAGIERFPPPSLDWLDAAAARPDAPPIWARSLVLVPSASPHRPAKRWPIDRFASLASHAAGLGWQPVVVGGGSDRPLGAAIAASAPGTLDLTGRTDLAGLAGVMRRAGLAIGNDTGPMHVAATMGCPSIVLFSGESDPALTAPRAPPGQPHPVRVVRVPRLDCLPIGHVTALLPPIAAEAVERS